ncbi:MAG: OsmC family protein [Bacteroidia bacterium]|nr:OsmC family protein [Bacteroidia bacterium]
MEMIITFDGAKKVIANYNGHTINTDQSISSGGNNSASTPFDLFLASLGTCTGIVVKSFCDKRDISTNGLKLIQNMEYDNTSHLVSKINIEIQLPVDFPEKYKEALINSAELCTVKRHLIQPPQINICTK